MLPAASYSFLSKLGHRLCGPEKCWPLAMASPWDYDARYEKALSGRQNHQPQTYRPSN